MQLLQKLLILYLEMLQNITLLCLDLLQRENKNSLIFRIIWPEI